MKRAVVTATGTVLVDLTPEEEAQLAQDAIDDAPARVLDTNKQTIGDQALAALAANRTYLAIATPNTAQMRSQIAALTKQTSGLIRFALEKFDGTD